LIVAGLTAVVSEGFDIAETLSKVIGKGTVGAKDIPDAYRGKRV
jgi:hypothetical protein